MEEEPSPENCVTFKCTGEMDDEVMRLYAQHRSTLLLGYAPLDADLKVRPTPLLTQSVREFLADPLPVRRIAQPR
jgi:hypothetical protein